MALEAFLLFVLLSWVVGRITRFIVADDLWGELREGIVDRLENPSKVRNNKATPGDAEVVLKSKRTLYLHEKLATLITCGWCVSIYVSAAVLVAQRIFVGPIPLPVWQWLGLSMLATLWVDMTDGVKQVKLEK